MKDSWRHFQGSLRQNGHVCVLAKTSWCFVVVTPSVSWEEAILTSRFQIMNDLNEYLVTIFQFFEKKNKTKISRHLCIRQKSMCCSLIASGYAIHLCL